MTAETPAQTATIMPTHSAPPAIAGPPHRPRCASRLEMDAEFDDRLEQGAGFKQITQPGHAPKLRLVCALFHDSYSVPDVMLSKSTRHQQPSLQRGDFLQAALVHRTRMPFGRGDCAARVTSDLGQGSSQPEQPRTQYRDKEAAIPPYGAALFCWLFGFCDVA